MIPILYEGNETKFLTNGIGRLSDAISCTVEENLNGLYELEMQYPITGVHYGDIETDRLILATPFDGGDPQPFRIYQISRTINGIVTINAEHISYLLNRVVVMPFQATSCATALAGLKSNAANNCPFTFSTTKTGSSTFTVSEPQPLRALLGGQKGSILDVYGKGEYEFDRWAVRLSTSRGSDHGVTLRYGKNLTELVRDSDISNAYTGIVPFWANADGEIVLLPEKIVWSEHRSAFAHEIVKAVDFSSEWQDAPTVAQLRARATAYVTANEGWTVSDNIKVSFVALWQTEEYKNIAVLERVHMGDTVNVVYEALGVEASAKVIRTVYDVLLERYDEIELGTAKNTLAQAIADPILEEVPTSSDMEQAIAHGTKLITGGLGGYVYMKPNANGQPEEILVMDDPDYTQATKLWRFNKNGIGFSKTGYNGEYKYAWTMDGAFYTDWVTAGRMTAALIKTGIITGQKGSMQIDVDNGTITLGNKALRITAGNFKLDANGNVTITGKLSNGKPSLNSSRDGVYVGTDGISIGTFNGGSASATGFKVTSGGVATLGGIRFFLANGNEAGYGLWAKNNGTHIGSGGPCDFNSDGDGTANKRNYLRNGTTLYGGVDVYAGMWMSGDLRFDTAHDYMIDDVNEIYASGKITCEQVIQTSDERRKEDITDLDKVEEFILALRPVRFKFKERDGYHHGFIAQEVQKALQDENDIVTEDKHGMLGLSYTEIIADLVGICQKQQQRIDDLEERLKTIEALLEGDGK